MAEVALPPQPPHVTTGNIGVWNGTKDGQEGFIDYGTNETNINSPKEIGITVQDIRYLESQPSLTKLGYEMQTASTALTAEDFLSDTPEGKARIEEVYFQECKDLLERIYGGAAKVIPSSYKVRKENKDAKSYDSQRFSPRPVAHLDRDPPTAIVPLHNTVGAEEAEVLLNKYNRWAQVNVWRPIGNVASKWPLAFMNHEGIPEWDYETHSGRVYSQNDPRNVERGVKSYDCIVKGDDRYTYYYASNMTPEEVLIFNSFDTDRKMVVPHGAFWDDNTPKDAPARQSIEVRSLVFFDEKEN